MSYANLVGFTAVCDAATTGVYYTPPIVREGAQATFSLDATHVAFGAMGRAVVTVEHKDFADTSWVAAGTFANITATGVKILTVSSLKEEIRLKIGFSLAVVNDLVHLVVAEPMWVPE